jgi:hypothetical protein
VFLANPNFCVTFSLTYNAATVLDGLVSAITLAITPGDDVSENKKTTVDCQQLVQSGIKLVASLPDDWVADRPIIPLINTIASSTSR